MIPRLPKGFTHPMRAGEGAFASVYRARQSALDRWVAIKMVYERDSRRRKELLQEARTQASIHAECIPQVYDAFEWRRGVCIVMQWIKGLPLSVVLEQQLSRADRRMLAHGFILALASLHSSQFAHRDLKPENVLISPQGVYLVDFGFTKLVAHGERSISTVAKGTPAYMAPELWRHGGNVDLMRADVYSAGRILNQILDDDEMLGLLRPLLEEDPNRRPESGGAVLAIWERAIASNVPTPAWARLVGAQSSRLLAQNLFTAAKQLLFAGKSDEAYWLLVECLEEDPENADAVRLMTNFAQYTRKHRFRRSVPLAAAAMASVMLSVLAFAAGWGSRDYEPILEHKGFHRELIGRAGPSAAFRADAQFREDSTRTDMLTGTLVISDVQDTSHRIELDGMSAGGTGIENKGIDVKPGEHVISLIDSGGGLVARERFRILPFQTKVISINAMKMRNSR